LEEKLNVQKIKEILTSTPEDQLEKQIERFQADDRESVKKLIENARKRIVALENEKLRIEALWKFERENVYYNYICGIDEAGRGPWVGPVVAGAVILPKDCDILYINDSKKLSEKKREELYDVIVEKALAWGVGYASPERIDEINILQATYEAMRMAISSLNPQPDLLLNDAVKIPGVKIPQIPIIKGDAKSISIGAASIIAKVTRDRMMRQYDELFPEFQFAKNKGYGTKEHIEALLKYGPTPIHRRSFIKNYVSES